MKNVITIFFISTITLSLLLSGCQSSAGVQVKHGTATTIDNYRFDNDIEVGQVVGTMSGELYNGTVIIKNTGSKDKSLQYQFTWYDNNSREIDIDSHGWTPITVYAKDQKTLNDVAPNPNATQFKVSVRELKATKVFKTNFFGRR